MPPSSHYYPPEYKHSVLLFYKDQKPPLSFRSVAKQFRIKGGAWTLTRWYKRWNGTVESLKPKPKSGRPRILTKAQVRKYVGYHIRSLNRKHEPASYKEKYHMILRQTKKKFSIQTLRRYGHEAIGIKNKRIIKRTHYECS
jgi:transposase